LVPPLPVLLPARLPSTCPPRFDVVGGEEVTAGLRATRRRQATNHGAGFESTWAEPPSPQPAYHLVHHSNIGLPTSPPSPAEVSHPDAASASPRLERPRTLLEVASRQCSSSSQTFEAGGAQVHGHRLGMQVVPSSCCSGGVGCCPRRMAGVGRRTLGSSHR
jgi:hypothetical protein